MGLSHIKGIERYAGVALGGGGLVPGEVLNSEQRLCHYYYL